MPRTLFVSLLLEAACTSPVPFGKCESQNNVPQTVTATVAYYRDVAPIIEARCVRCHQPDNIGPFPLTTYQEVFAARTAIKAAVMSRHMPPWLPSDCCNHFRDDDCNCPVSVPGRAARNRLFARAPLVLRGPVGAACAANKR